MKKGFTLIELLAVIVILAIIALIATPIVMNIISDSRKSAAERSAENYVKQVETSITDSYLNPSSKIGDGVYEIMSDGNLCIGTISDNVCYGIQQKSIDMSGTKPTGGTLYVKNGSIIDGSYLKIDDNVINLVNSKSVVDIYEIDAIKNYATGDTYNDKAKNYIKNQTSTIKYDPVSSSKCTSGTTCYEWYILEDKGSDYASVNLIMDSNISSTGLPVKSIVANDIRTTKWVSESDYIAVGGKNWSLEYSSGNNSLGPITANIYLKEATKTWNDIAALPSIEQISSADGKKYTGGYSVGSISSSWLRGYIDKGDGITANQYNVNGYWMSTASLNSGNELAWALIKSIGTVMDFGLEGNYGVRPTINVLKSKLN